MSNKSLKLNGVDIEDTYKGDKYLHALSKNNNKLDDAIRVGADSKLYQIILVILFVFFPRVLTGFEFDDAKLLCIIAEIMAKDIKVNLNSNTDKIERANNNVIRIQTQLGLADRLINIISRNEKRNTLILY